MNNLSWDPFTLRAEKEIGVGRGGGGVADYEEGDVDVLGVGEDGVGLEFDGFSGCDDYFFAVEFFLMLLESQRCPVFDTNSDEKLTSLSLETIRILVYASRYTLALLFTACVQPRYLAILTLEDLWGQIWRLTSNPLTVMSFSSLRPRPITYSMVPTMYCWVWLSEQNDSLFAFTDSEAFTPWYRRICSSRFLVFASALAAKVEIADH